MIDISDLTDFPSPDWSNPIKDAKAGVEGLRSLFPQAPPSPLSPKPQAVPSTPTDTPTDSKK